MRRRRGRGSRLRELELSADARREAGAAEPVNRDSLAIALAYGRTAELMNYSVMAIRERGAMPTWEASAARQRRPSARR